MSQTRFHLHLVSDSTGETVHSVARACLVQFDEAEAVEHIWSMVRTKMQMERVIHGIEANPGVVLFTLVDHPAISLGTIDALLQRPLPLIRIPRHSGERGHPIWFRKDLIREFLALPLSAPANQVTRAHRAEPEFVDLEDPGVIADIDDPPAYERLLAGSRA